ncbi:hypothetical protein C8R43DRAFT_907018, partial [Mycena crocata]
SKWIWTAEMAQGTAPVGVRTFRKAFMAPEGKIPVFAHILVAADDSQDFFVNGKAVITGRDWTIPRAACVSLKPCLNVFAIKAQNVGGPAGVLVAIRVTYSDKTVSTLVSDSSWRVATDAPVGFETNSFDDNTWTTAYTFGLYGVAPWNTLTVPNYDAEKCEAVSTTPCPCQAVCDVSKETSTSLD